MSVNSNGTYDIRYDDGDEERNVSAYKIRRKAGAAASTKLREGDAVEARYRGREKYYKGKISRDRMDGTYDINYDDGEKELRVEERFIRKLADDSSHLDLLIRSERATRSRPAIEVGRSTTPAKFQEIEATGPTTLPTTTGKGRRASRPS